MLPPTSSVTVVVDSQPIFRWRQRARGEKGIGARRIGRGVEIEDGPCAVLDEAARADGGGANLRSDHAVPTIGRRAVCRILEPDGETPPDCGQAKLLTLQPEDELTDRHDLHGSAPHVEALVFAPTFAWPLDRHPVSRRCRATPGARPAYHPSEANASCDHVIATITKSTGWPVFFDSCLTLRPMKATSPRFHLFVVLPSTVRLSSASPNATIT